MDEVVHFQGYSPATRVRGAALYVAGQRIMATTLLYSYNIQTTNLIQWCTGVTPEGSVNMVLGSGLARPLRGQGGESAMFSQTKVAFEHFFGFRIAKGLYPGANWLPPTGGLAAAASYYNANCVNDLDEAPRLTSCLIIDEFLLVRPQEWGILGPRTEINFLEDLIAQSSAELRGLYSDLGDTTYKVRVTSSQPYLLVPYGIQMLNAVHQHFEIAARAPQYRRAVFQGRRAAGFSSEVLTYASHKYINALFIYEPCSIWTFDWADNTIRAPCIQGADRLSRTVLAGLQLWRGSQIPEIGFALQRLEAYELGGMDPPFAGGMAGISDPGEDGGTAGDPAGADPGPGQSGNE